LRPAGVVGDGALAFLPIRTGHDNDGAGIGGGNPGGGSPGQKDFYLDYEDAHKDAIANNKLIFIDFTGVNCTNCRYNEGSVFPLPNVKDELSKFVKVALYTDKVPKPGLSPRESADQATRNYKWQLVLANEDITRPFYVV